MTISRNIRLYGTEEAPAAERLIRAGKLSVLFDGMNLRDIRVNGEEVIRAISFVVRDKDWATLIPVITNLRIEENGQDFRIGYQASVASKGETFDYTVAIRGGADGNLTYHGRGKTKTGFQTNRTGFVILHPIAGVSGADATVTHTDGTVDATTFPIEINPVQPMMDLRRIEHRTAGGQTVSCLMEGDTFEMEDQRQWTDASYKTYVRPLALPWPYRLVPGEDIDQTITLTVTGSPNIAALRVASAAVELVVAQSSAFFPPLGLGLQPQEAEASMAQAESLRMLAVEHVICHYDPRRGHNADSLARQVRAAEAIGVETWLEAVITSIDADAVTHELRQLSEVSASLGHPFRTVLVSPAPDLKCTLPGSPWPPAPDAEAMYRSTRAAFPGSRIGGGMFSFFTELNRKRPPTDPLDVVSFTTAAIFHAGDDRSMMETLECLPHIVRTIPAIAKGKPYLVGPSAIGMRDNPYGEASVANPLNIRQAVNYNDPRQRGIMGAAWYLGYVAAFATGGAAAVTLGSAVGPFGLISVPMDYPQPGFQGKGEYYPVFHVVRGLTRLKRSPVASVQSPDGRARGLTTGTELWLANTSSEPLMVQLPDSYTQISVLDAAQFEIAKTEDDLFDRLTRLVGNIVTLDAFAVLRAL